MRDINHTIIIQQGEKRKEQCQVDNGGDRETTVKQFITLNFYKHMDSAVKSFPKLVIVLRKTHQAFYELISLTKPIICICWAFNLKIP